MAGMLAGNMLIRQGWDIAILERSREGLEARGAGIVPQRDAGRNVTSIVCSGDGAAAILDDGTRFGRVAQHSSS
jgi:2-polyprenyl-6-methoxyphenol hydroxylase-like FAD-dependent oxidoreductase